MRKRRYALHFARIAATTCGYIYTCSHILILTANACTQQKRSIIISANIGEKKKCTQRVTHITHCIQAAVAVAVAVARHRGDDDDVADVLKRCAPLVASDSGNKLAIIVFREECANTRGPTKRSTTTATAKADNISYDDGRRTTTALQVHISRDRHRHHHDTQHTALRITCCWTEAFFVVRFVKRKVLTRHGAIIATWTCNAMVIEARKTLSLIRHTFTAPCVLVFVYINIACG